MKYCKKCLQPDTRPGIKFNEEGVCYACLYAEKMKTIDWGKREQELMQIAREAKAEAKARGNLYDCIIGVSGGKDSTFQAVYAKEKLGLHPLLINCMPDEITEVGRHNLDNLNALGDGFDVISIRPNPVVAKKLARKSFFERGNIVAASEYCLWASSYVMADKMGIPLIIQGENAALTLGTALNQDTSGNAFNVVDLNTLHGFDTAELIEGTDLTEKDVYFYKMPDVESMKAKGIRAIWLQYYAKEWSQVRNADFAVARGLWGRMHEDLHDIGRYRRFSALDSDLQIVNQMIKYLKFGFGFTTDEVCYDIREDRLSREDAKWYVKEYDGKCGEQYIDLACKYLSITREEFWEVVDGYVNKDLFEKNEKGVWVPKFEVGVDTEKEPDKKDADAIGLTLKAKYPDRAAKDLMDPGITEGVYAGPGWNGAEEQKQLMEEVAKRNAPSTMFVYAGPAQMANGGYTSGVNVMQQAMQAALEKSQEKTVEVNAGSFCPVCGAKVNEKMKFCMECGSPLGDAPNA